MGGACVFIVSENGSHDLLSDEGAFLKLFVLPKDIHTSIDTYIRGRASNNGGPPDKNEGP